MTHQHSFSTTVALSVFPAIFEKMVDGVEAASNSQRPVVHLFQYLQFTSYLLQ